MLHTQLKPLIRDYKELTLQELYDCLLACEAHDNFEECQIIMVYIKAAKGEAPLQIPE